MPGTNPTEPANYRGSYTRGSKEIADTETAMHQSAETVIIDAITIAPRTIARTATQMLLLYAYAYFFLS
jgi:hypothetical protein